MRLLRRSCRILNVFYWDLRSFSLIKAAGRIIEERPNIGQLDALSFNR